MSNTMLPKIVINLIRMVRKNACGGIYIFSLGLNWTQIITTIWTLNCLKIYINRFQSWKKLNVEHLSSDEPKSNYKSTTWALKILNPWTLGFIQHYYLFYHDMISPPLYGRKIEYSVFSEFTLLKILCHLL